MLGHSQPAATLAVVSRENLETAEQLKACLEHVDVVVVVFDVENFGHDTDPILTSSASAPAYQELSAERLRISLVQEGRLPTSGHCPTLDAAGRGFRGSNKAKRCAVPLRRAS
jgi:hypothetical protein